MLDIKITKTTAPKEKPKGNLGFGRIFTDHMFVMDYTQGVGWHDPRIVPYQDLTLSPAAMVFHYGQEMFEGLKAYKGDDGANYLFRPDMNAKRTNDTNDRLCIPRVPEEDYVQAVKAIVSVDQDWIPTAPGTSLYIRPFIIATEPFLGVDVSQTFQFIIILSPSGAYYESGLEPVGIWIEDDYVRAVRGGMGFAKTGGNYAASIKAGELAEEQGYAQVLWLDGVEKKYVEEVGSMNIMFKIDGKVYGGEIVYTGPLDELFNLDLGALPYRTLDMKFETLDMDQFQPVGTVNYTTSEDYTRITEFKNMTGQVLPGKTTIMKEYSKAYTPGSDETPYYAILEPENRELYERYLERVQNLTNFHPVGRLAEYRYYDMDAVTNSALDLSDEIIACHA